ncbi:MAG: hypothetical protein H0W89_01305 [Candidatus Levybacteria bacterium]|nr:hypothetical protein [Candidatus Levybacteria bacterium]
MQIIKNILYKPYLLLFISLAGWIYYYSINKPINDILTALFAYTVYIFFFWKIFPYLENSLLKITGHFSLFDSVPNHIISGYCFIATLLFPIPVLVIALFSKLFIKEKLYHSSFTDEYGNSVTRIKSLTPTVILSRKEGRNGDEEHIVMTKLKKIPRKITYE